MLLLVLNLALLGVSALKAAGVAGVALFTTHSLVSKRRGQSVPFLIYQNACDLGITNLKLLLIKTPSFFDYESDGRFTTGHIFERL